MDLTLSKRFDFRKKNTVSNSDEQGRDGSSSARVQIELQNTQCAELRMTQDSPRNGIQMVLNLPPSYEEALRTSAADDSAFREATVAFDFRDCNRNRDTFVRTISLPPSYEDAVHNTSTSVYPAASSDDVIHV